VLTIEEESQANCCTVCRAFGDLDAFTVAQFRDRLAHLPTSGHLVIDLSGVPFVDSAGLGALVGFIRRVRDHGGFVVLACNRPTLVRVLRMTGVDRIVPIAATVDKAIATFEREQPAHQPPTLQLS
jgi:anti-sigma B factor antagonist